MGCDVTLSNVTDSVGVLGVAGPRSRELLQKLTSCDLSQEAFDFLQCTNLNIAGVDCFAIRISYTGTTTPLFFFSNDLLSSVFSLSLHGQHLTPLFVFSNDLLSSVFNLISEIFKL